MSWSSVKSIIGNTLPAIAGILGTPAAVAPIKALCNIFGLKDDAKPDEIAEALQNATPEQLLRAKEIDSYERIRNAEITVYDRDSARKMNIAGRENKDNTPRNLAYIISFMLFLMIFLICSSYINISGTERDIACMLLGMLANEWKGAMQFYFGTTINSGKKDDVISQLKTKDK